MLNKIKEFFSKMKNDEHSLFEIIMFSISGVVSVVVLVCAIMLGNFMFSKQDTVTAQEADAGSVTWKCCDRDGRAVCYCHTGCKFCGS